MSKWAGNASRTRDTSVPIPIPPTPQTAVGGLSILPATTIHPESSVAICDHQTESVWLLTAIVRLNTANAQAPGAVFFRLTSR